MATTPLVYTDAFFSLDGTDLSDDVMTVSISSSSDDVEITSMGSAGWREFTNGLKQATVTVQFIQDFAASGVDSILFPLLGGDAAEVVIRPTAAVAGSGNPEFTGSSILIDSSPVDATVGDLAEVSATFRVTGVITRGVGA